jgi:hypothetical protein
LSGTAEHRQGGGANGQALMAPVWLGCFEAPLIDQNANAAAAE